MVHKIAPQASAPDRPFVDVRRDRKRFGVRSWAADVRVLRKPSPNPAVMPHHCVEDTESRLAAKLRTAWYILSWNS